MREWKETEIGQIPINWEVGTIDNIAEVVTDGAHSSPKLFLGGRYMASVKDMTYNSFDFSECKTISELDFENLKRQGCSPKRGDILISKDGEKCLDLIFVYNQEEEIVLLSSIAIVRLKKNYNVHFYRYYLLSYVAQTIMYKWFRSGSAIPRVVLRDFKKVPVPIIGRKEQDNIASILLNIDKKISLLRQQNQDLEELAQTLFKRWFVEFEFPNENGEPYKSSGGKMVESELGEIPEGWRVGKLEDITSRITDGSHFSPSSVENGLPMASVKDMNDWNFNIDSCRKISKEDYDELVRNDCKPLKNDILIAKDGSYLKHVFVAPKDLDVVLLSSIAMLRPNGDYHPILLSIFLKLKSTIREMKNIVSGAVIERIVLKDFRKFSLIIPSIDIQMEASLQIEPLIKKCWTNIDEIQTLTQLRNTLLPKLMSGELRVKN
ncbi:restriction endonuclease subunit S [Saccharicrinis fermentans]|uniref:EcoKI restriction-modification system protein HsdS n=1 Tax=Saccharicrinis fermentans DSM 9555 = JCM 21142 TaxID=869213 RepID=W7YGU8_9BACT|nr:restriction endonuclease subunit S [Saccharicrinis fermentans]GAF03616.1 EcoKI restriction-modification system protein HsdS [Saccharicrinis fermentans DSM 9555 = JCM 21142]